MLRKPSIAFIDMRCYRNLSICGCGLDLLREKSPPSIAALTENLAKFLMLNRRGSQKAITALTSQMYVLIIPVSSLA